MRNVDGMSCPYKGCIDPNPTHGHMLPEPITPEEILERIKHTITFRGFDGADTVVAITDPHKLSVLLAEMMNKI